MVSRSKLLPLTLEWVSSSVYGVQAAVDLPPVEGEKRFPATTSIDWTSLEDEVLRRAYEKHGEEGRGKWAKMSGYFTCRKVRDCSSRWYNCLDPDKKPRKQKGKNPSKSAEEILDSEYKDLVGKSDLVTEVSFSINRDID